MEIGRIQPVNRQQAPMEQSAQHSEQNRKNHPDGKEQAIAQEVLSEKDMIKAVEGLNKMFESAHTHIQFTYHEELGKYYVKIMNENDEVIKEIPSKKILDMVAEMGKSLGLIFDKKI